MLALGFHLVLIAGQPLRFIERLFTLPHALCLVVDGASILSFAIGAVSMEGVFLAVFLECATDVLGIYFWLVFDWTRLRCTLRVRCAVMYFRNVIYRN